MMPLYWLRAWNFGDLLNPVLYKAMTGQEAVFSENSPKILAIGSTMRAAAPGDIVWGAGCISADTPLNCDESTRFRAVRGPYSKAVLQGRGFDIPEDIPFGDPSLLLPRFIKPAAKQFPAVVGFLPHYIDFGQVGRIPAGVTLLNPATDPLTLIGQITACIYIVSSSLHGICVPEAYGIPAVWVKLADNIVGGEFKFRDYYASTGRDVHPQDWRRQYFWEDAKIAANHWAQPEYDLDPLMEVCPFGE